MSNLLGFWTLLKRETLRFFSLPNQTIWPSVVSVSLYIVIFGFFLGKQVTEIEGQPYIVFIFPGLLMMSVVMASFQNSSTSLFIARWEHFIDDLLVAPISFMAMVLAYSIAAVIRGVVTGALVLIVGLFLVPTPLEHPVLLFWALVASSTVFATSGLVAGLWAERWDHIAIVLNYVVTPLMFLGGVFYATSTLPSGFKWVNELNPIFYMVCAARYAFVSQADAPYGLSLLITSILALFFLVWAIYLFRIGYKLRT